jgi:hypothetical protein
MAQQDDTAVDINGGAIDNTSIGATTPSTGAFTTLTSTGQTSLGGNSSTNAQSFRAYPYGGNAFVGVRGHTLTSVAPAVFSASSTQTNLNLQMATQGTGSIQFSTGGSLSSSGLFNQIDQMRVSHTTSAVNYVQVTGSATGLGPTISAQGSDANIGANVVLKGTGSISVFNGAGTSSRLFRATSSSSSSVNYLQLEANTATNAPILSAQGTDTNIDLSLTPKGTGAVNAGTQNANFLRLAGNSTTNSPELSVAGTDANIPLTFESKGTGAINLASGSRGVNISNGGTVTGITRTATGLGYTTPPDVAISAPTTAGGVQATATANLTNAVATATITSGGTGYTVNDVLTFVGGTFTLASQVRVTAVSAGVITAISTTNGGIYSIVPTNPISVTGGTGTGATFTLSNWALSATFTITNAGSGYVEQPTVTFSGGGGSGASAYASVGAGSFIRA